MAGRCSYVAPCQNGPGPAGGRLGVKVVNRIVIIGGGPAGYEAALVAAQLDADVTIIEADGAGGGVRAARLRTVEDLHRQLGRW